MKISRCSYVFYRLPNYWTDFFRLLFCKVTELKLLSEWKMLVCTFLAVDIWIWYSLSINTLELACWQNCKSSRLNHVWKNVEFGKLSPRLSRDCWLTSTKKVFPVEKKDRYEYYQYFKLWAIISYSWPSRRLEHIAVWDDDCIFRNVLSLSLSLSLRHGQISTENLQLIFFISIYSFIVKSPNLFIISIQKMWFFYSS